MTQEEQKTERFSATFNTSLSIAERIHELFSASILFILRHKTSEAHRLLEVIYDDLYSYLTEKERTDCNKLFDALNLTQNAIQQTTPRHGLITYQKNKTEYDQKLREVYRKLRDLQEAHDLGMSQKQDVGTAALRGRF